MSILTGKLKKQEGIVFAAVAVACLTIDKINVIADSLGRVQPLNLKPEPDFFREKKLYGSSKSGQLHNKAQQEKDVPIVPLFLLKF